MIGRYRGLGLLVLAVVSVLGLAACSSSSADDGPEDSQPVTLMLNWTPNAHHVGIYVAEAKGWYDKAGIDLTVIEPAQSGVEQAVASGAAQLGMAQAESLLPARAAGVPVVSVATVLPVNDSSLFALASDGIDRPKDLEGKRYGGFGGALETEIISRLVTCDGGDPGLVDFVNLGNVDYLAGLEADQFDVAWVFSGWDALRASEIEGAEISEIRFADWLDCIPNWYTPLFLTSEGELSGDPELVRDFLAATTRGYDYAVEYPDEAASLLTEQVPELDEALVEAAVRYYAPLFRADGQQWGTQESDTWKRFADFLADAGMLQTESDQTGQTPTDTEADFVESAYSNDYLPGAGTAP